MANPALHEVDNMHATISSLPPPVAPRIAKPAGTYAIVDDASAESRREAYDASRFAELKAEIMAIGREIMAGYAAISRTLEEMRASRLRIQAELDEVTEALSDDDEATDDLVARGLDELIAEMPRDSSTRAVEYRKVLFAEMAEAGVGSCSDYGWEREEAELLEKTGMHALTIWDAPWEDIGEARLLLEDGSLWEAGGRLGMIRAETA